MFKDRFKLVASAYLLLVKNDHILLLQRQNTGYEDGNYSVPAGHLDGNETVTDAVIREAKEETGITLYPNNLQVVHVMNRKDNREQIDIFFCAKSWNGEVTNMEPEKCGDLSWFPLSNLPDNIIPYVRMAIAYWQSKTFYSELGYHTDEVVSHFVSKKPLPLIG